MLLFCLGAQPRTSLQDCPWISSSFRSILSVTAAITRNHPQNYQVLQPGEVSHCPCLQPEVSQRPAGVLWVGAAAPVGRWVVFGWTEQVFGVAQGLAGQSLQDTELGLELHWSVSGSGLSAATRGHVWGHPRWDWRPPKRKEKALIVQQHSTTLMAPFRMAQPHKSTLTETLKAMYLVD